MRLFLFNLFIFECFLGFTFSQQIEHVRIGQDTLVSENLFPHINQYYEGEIPIVQLGDLEGIQTAKNYKVNSFVVSYPKGEKNISIKVEGNVFSKDLIEDIYKFGLGQMIFITDILVEDENKKTFKAVSMNLIPIE